MDELVLAILAGDQSAWQQLGPRLRVAIRPCFQHYYFSEADIEDLTQQTMTILVRKLPEFEVRAGEPFARWARKIARARAVDELRRRFRGLRLVQQLAEVPHPTPTSFSSQLHRAQQAANLELLRRAIDRLTSPYRRVIQNDLVGGDLDALAEREGIGRGAVRTRRHRAYKKLRELVIELTQLASPSPTPSRS